MTRNGPKNEAEPRIPQRTLTDTAPEVGQAGRQPLGGRDDPGLRGQPGGNGRGRGRGVRGIGRRHPRRRQRLGGGGAGTGAGAGGLGGGGGGMLPRRGVTVMGDCGTAAATHRRYERTVLTYLVSILL